MSTHHIRVSYQQAFFDTPTVCNFSVAAKDAASAVSAIRHHYRHYSVQVEFIATFNR